MQRIFKNKIKIPIFFLVFILVFTFFIQSAKAALPSENFLSYPNLTDLRRSIDLEFGSGAININNFLEKFGQIGGTLQILNTGYSSFSPETGDYTSVSNMITHLRGLDKLNTISDIITRVINMGGTAGDLLFQINNIRTWLNVVNSLENLEIVFQMMVDLNNLGAEFDDLFGPSSYGSVAGFLVTMNELENIESVSQSIGAFVGQPGGNLENILNTFGGSLTELIANLNSPNGEETVTQVLSQIVGSATREERDQAADEQEVRLLEELQKQDAILCGQEHSGGLGANTIIESLTSGEIIEGLQNMSANELSQIITNLSDADLNSLITNMSDGELEEFISNLPPATQAAIAFGQDPREAIRSLSKQVVSNALASLGEQVADSLVNLGKETITNALSEAGGQVLSNFVSNIPGLSSFTSLIPGLGIGGGLSVPTQEQQGPLLSSNLSIQALSVEVCTYTKTAKRIQQARERQEFGLEPKLRRDAATASENFRRDIDDVVKTGFDVDGDGTGNRALFVKNTDEHLTNVVETEATAVFLDDLKNSNDIFKEETALTIEQIRTPEQLESTITENDYSNFINGNTPMSNFWSTYLTVVNPSKPNNPITSQAINEITLNEKIKLAKNNAREEISASGGWLPIRDCKELTSDGSACREWEVVTPATNVRLSSEEVLVNQLNRYLDPQPGDVAPGNEPKAQELLENRVIDVGGGGAGGANLSFSGILNLILDLFGIGFEI